MKTTFLGYNSGIRRTLYLDMEVEGTPTPNITSDTILEDAGKIELWMHQHLPNGTYLALLRAMCHRYESSGGQLEKYGIQLVKSLDETAEEIITDYEMDELNQAKTPQEQRRENIAKAQMMLNSAPLPTCSKCGHSVHDGRPCNLAPMCMICQ